MTTETPLTFTDADGSEWGLLAWSRSDDRRHPATIPDLIAALTPHGYAVVPVLGAEPTESPEAFAERLASKIYANAWHNFDGPGAIRERDGSLFRAGSASRQPEIDELTARLNAANAICRTRLEALDELRASERAAQELLKNADDQVADCERANGLLRDRAESAERRVGWLRVHRRRLWAKLERAEFRAEHADARARQYLLDDGAAAHVLDELAATKVRANVSEGDRARAEAELARVRAELETRQEDDRLAAGELLVPLPTPGTDAARMMRANVLMRRQRDEARAKLTECERERDAWNVTAENQLVSVGKLRSRLDQQRAVVEAARLLTGPTFDSGHEAALRRALRDLDALSSAGSSSPQDSEPRCEHCNMREHAYSRGGRCPLGPEHRHSFDECIHFGAIRNGPTQVDWCIDCGAVRFPGNGKEWIEPRTQRAEPVAQGVSVLRVSSLRDALYSAVKGANTEAVRVFAQNVLEQVEALLAASPDGDPGGGT